jgi:exonuclease III
VKIANWNLQVFGPAKASDLQLMNIYVDKIEDYDIIFVQEIKDSSQEAFPKLCSLLQNYSCKSSSRAGRTIYKEQYGVIYKNGINVTGFEDFNPDSEDRWERPPIKVDFRINNYSITAYNIHTKPEEAEKEIQKLQNVVEDNGKVILLGDLNADCSYYDENKFNYFPEWNWIIDGKMDTTSSNTNCAYDRIILNNDAKKDLKNFGVDSKNINKEVSDHYLVWVEMKI